MPETALSALMGMMIGAGDIDELVSGLDWPMHQALRELYEEAGRVGATDRLPTTSFRPYPGVAWRADGADEALWELRVKGLLVPRGSGLTGKLVVNDDLRGRHRRDLLRLGLPVSELVYRAGVRWAALAATAAKNWVTVEGSAGSQVSAGTPAVLQSSRSGRR